jgi:hypothetical protein
MLRQHKLNGPMVLAEGPPISCNDCPAFQRFHMSIRWLEESFTRLGCVTNTTL